MQSETTTGYVAIDIDPNDNPQSATADPETQRNSEHDTNPNHPVTSPNPLGDPDHEPCWLSIATCGAFTCASAALIALTAAAGATGAAILDAAYPDYDLNVKDITKTTAAGGSIVYLAECCFPLLLVLADRPKNTLTIAAVFAVNTSVASALGHTLFGGAYVTLGATVAAGAVGGAVLGTVIGACCKLSSKK